MAKEKEIEYETIRIRKSISNRLHEIQEVISDEEEIDVSMSRTLKVLIAESRFGWKSKKHRKEEE